VSATFELDLRDQFPTLGAALPPVARCFASSTIDRDPLSDPGAVDLLGDDMGRVATWRSRARRCHYYSGRVAAAAVARSVGLEPRVDTDKLGAPFLHGTEGPEPISITHSGDYALAAIAKGHVFGLDYEIGLAGRAHLRRRVCGSGELRIHDLIDPETADRAWALGCIWTLKEALFKAYGVGLVAELKDVEVGPVAPDGHVHILALRPLHHAIPHPLPAGLYAAVTRFEGHPLAIVGCARPRSA
jgi:4'-phosphopantetheinyl transferase